MQWTIDAAGARDLDRRITESGVEEFLSHDACVQGCDRSFAS